jgi:alpha-amylase/alpha-mannosidase (GH57 family)
MTSTGKYLCIHGHFYQPPRENAWLESIELQESASPYHDWNDRITDESYGPNCVSRILNEKGEIVDIVNNFSMISYNVGPTLLSWMELHQPLVYQRIIESDAQSKLNFGGHGSAMAQVYNHIIMPLASYRDKVTQVRWGIADFKRRFGREPEGMWLAETAVDTETLEVLADHGISFTVLAPSQASRFRSLSIDEPWREGVDTRLAYTCKLAGGKKIALFFYDGHLSQQVAFGGLLKSGKDFANALMSSFRKNTLEPQLVHIATDGETFGHHHRHGDMALAFCLDYIQHNQLATIVNYGQYLELCPPKYEVEIVEKSSWSCAHGIERWRSNCGCSTGGEPGWTQHWRAPLRQSLDNLNRELSSILVDECRGFTFDPWEVRNQYIDVFYSRSRSNSERFFEQHVGRKLSSSELTHLIRLFEMQRHVQLMYTSCGWFFNDIGGIETIQILQYACRAIQLAQLVTGKDLESEFINHLAQGVSNDLTIGTGEDIYLQEVSHKKLSLTQVAMHYAAYTLFAEDDNFDVLNYRCLNKFQRNLKQGQYRLAIGHVLTESLVTYTSQPISYGLLHLGNHHLMGFASISMDLNTCMAIADELDNKFSEGNLTYILDKMQGQFFDARFTFQDLFRDEQMTLMDLALDEQLTYIMKEYESIHNKTYTLINQMRVNRLNIPLFFEKNISALLALQLEIILKGDISIQFPKDTLVLIVTEVERWSVHLDSARLRYLATRRINDMSVLLGQTQDDYLTILNRIIDFINMMKSLGIKPHLHELQNAIFKLMKNNHIDNATMPSLRSLCKILNMNLR